MIVLHIIPNMHIGGAQKSLLNIIKALPQVNHFLFSSENEWNLPYHNNFKFVDSRKNNFITELQKIKPDIIHFQWWPAYRLPNLSLLKQRFNCHFKVVVTIQDPTTINTQNADLYISCSKSVDELQSSIPTRHRKIIKDYIDVQAFRNFHKTPHKGINIVRHSMIYPNKIDCSILLKSNSLINKLKAISGTKNIKMIICGDGGFYREQMIHFSEKHALDNLYFFPGKAIPNVLSIGDIFLYNTPKFDSEGFANVISEAEAAGLPIIADNRGGNIEQVLSGKNGFLVNDYEEEKEDLLFLLDKEKRKRFGSASLKIAQDSGGLKELGREYFNAYKYVLQRKCEL